MGGRKLYELLEPFMMSHQIKMGRDALFDVLAANNLLVKRRKRRFFTTQSFHWLRKYPNQIRHYIPSKPNQLWVSDITYWNGDPLENPIAERVNGIIKNEYLDSYQVNTLHVAKQLLEAVIDVYNNERPHMSLGNLTPNQVHQEALEKERLWK